MRTSGRAVSVEKLKWSGAVSARWPARLVRAEPGCLCLLTARGELRERPSRGVVETVEQHELAVAGEGWWVVTATLTPDGQVLRYKVDVATPAAWAGPRRVRFVDLDLDLAFASADGEVRLLDEDVFAQRAAALRYPRRVREGALGGVLDARRRVEERRWPFDGWIEARAADLAAEPAGSVATGS